MLGVSGMTIYRRRVVYGLIREPINVPTDAQLCMVLRDMKLGHPELGEVLVMGRLRAMGYKVTRERLRQTIRSIDPLYTALRWRGCNIQDGLTVYLDQTLYGISVSVA